MGHIAQVLSWSDVEKHFHFRDDLRIESAEAIHLHWRDVRILLTCKQFEDFVDALEVAYNRWDGGESAEDLVLATIKIPDGTIFKDIISLEEQQNGDVHFHYQDMRIEMTKEMFIRLADMFAEAKAAL